MHIEIAHRTETAPLAVAEFAEVRISTDALQITRPLPQSVDGERVGRVKTIGLHRGQRPVVIQRGVLSVERVGIQRLCLQEDVHDVVDHVLHGE